MDCEHAANNSCDLNVFDPLQVDDKYIVIQSPLFEQMIRCRTDQSEDRKNGDWGEIRRIWMDKYMCLPTMKGVSFKWRRHLKKLSKEEIVKCFEVDDPDFQNGWSEDEEENIALAYAFLKSVYVSKCINGNELPKRHFINPETELGKQCRRAIARLLVSDNQPSFLLSSLARMIEPRNRKTLEPVTEGEQTMSPNRPSTPHHQPIADIRNGVM